MKLLTFAIPCYNSQDYMEHCIDSILPGGEDIEILIIDDGSKDRTAEIADDYERRYPGIVRAIHQENGGHGEAVNAGIRNATGLYFKVVDSDDWVDADAYKKILEKLREFAGGPTTIDMLLANYVYEKEGAKHKKVMRQTAPRSSDRRGQPYADSFAVKTRPGGIVAGKYRNRRVAATIVNTADHAPALEFGRDRAGWRQDPPRRVMLKAGLKFGDTNRVATAAAAAATLRPVRIRRGKR